MSTRPAPRPVTPTGIVSDRLDRLAERLARLDLDPALVAEVEAVCELARGLDPYVARCTTPPSTALQSLDRLTRAEDWGTRGDGVLEQEMLSGHVEGQLLRFLVLVSKARRVLDLGMFTGYSALAMAEALPDDGDVVACEIDPHVVGLARRAFGDSPHGHKIAVEVGPALSTLSRLALRGDRFDLVFVDADKQGYSGYLEALLGWGLLAPDGLICVDNTLLQGEPWTSSPRSPNGHAIAAFNASVVEDPRVEQVLLPVRDGLTLIRRA